MKRFHQVGIGQLIGLVLAGGKFVWNKGVHSMMPTQLFLASAISKG